MSIKFTKTDQIGMNQNGEPASLLAVRDAQQHARDVARNLSALTDSSGGSVSFPQSVNLLPTFADFLASGSTLADATAFAASLAKLKNALGEVATKARSVALAVGAPVEVWDGGGTATGTVPALDLTATAISGVAPTASGLLTVTAAYNTAFIGLVGLVNGIDVATGNSLVKPVPTSFGSQYTSIPGASLPVAATATSATAGLRQSDVTTWLATAANNVATLAYNINQVVGPLTGLTDSSGGTASVYSTIVASPVLPADALLTATTNGPTVATLDTKIGVVVNALASLDAEAAKLLAKFDLNRAVAYTGAGSVSATLASVGNTGSGAATGPTAATVQPVVTAIDESFAALAKNLDLVLPLANLKPLAFEYTATPAATGAITVTLSGVATGQSKVTLDAILANWANNIATVAAVINAAVARVNGPVVLISK